MQLTKHEGYFSLDSVLMRSTSKISDASWLAAITGPHPQYRFTRQFIERVKDDRGTSNGTQSFGPLYHNVVYEYRSIAGDGQSAYSYARNGGRSGFFRIVDDAIEDLSMVDVMAIIQNTLQPSNDTLMTTYKMRAPKGTP